MPDYRAESCVIDDPDSIKQEWSDLQSRADCSYFQSWGWIGTWLKHVVSDLSPVLVKISCDDEIVGLGIFVSRQLVRHRILRSKAIFLNECPYDGRNMVIEYNGLLADKQHKRAVYKETLRHIYKINQDVEEFFFSGLSEKEFSDLSNDNALGSSANFRVIEKSLTWSVRLGEPENNVTTFLETLSKNRRAQIRRSIKAYEERAPLELVEAKSVEEALSFFDGLKKLHTARWKLKGEDGSFSNPLWEKFHRELIASRFSNGEIQLLRVGNASEVVGYLYNYTWRKHTYVLQTGFNMENDKRLMPGYIVHVLAIVYNRQKGMDIYDLMHGDSLYKKILCNRNHALFWSVVQRKKLKFYMEGCVRKILRKLRD